MVRFTEPEDFPPDWEAHEPESEEASPTADVIYSQSVKATGNGGVRNYDLGRKINRHDRQIFVDAVGLVVHGAGILRFHVIAPKAPRMKVLIKQLTGCLEGNRPVYYAETRGVLLKSAL